MLSKKVHWNYGNTVLSYIFLALKEREGDGNEDIDFEKLLHFEKASSAK